MMTRLRVATCVSLAFGIFAFPLHAGANLIKFQVPGATATVPRTITNKGVVYGFFTDAAGQHGFRREAHGTYTTIDVPGATSTTVIAVRRDGTIIGNYSGKTDDNTFFTRGYERSPDGHFTDVVAPGGKGYTSASALTKAGWIAGTSVKGSHGASFGFLRNPRGRYITFGEQLTVVCANSGHTTAGTVTADGATHGFVRTRDGTITQFDPADSVYTVVSAINDAGMVTGYFKTSKGVNWGFARAADGTISTFAAPGKKVEGTGPLSINKIGAIAGYYQSRVAQGGFVRASDGNMTTIDVPGGNDTEINSINDKGEIAGEFKKHGVVTGFIWKP